MTSHARTTRSHRSALRVRIDESVVGRSVRDVAASQRQLVRPFRVSGASATAVGEQPSTAPSARVRSASAMAVVTMKQLLESGVHFGHQTRRWNPKMKRFIFTERNGIYIIDLQQSLTYIDRAYEFVKETVAHGGTVMFVGTKKQAQEADRRAGHPRRHALRQPALARRHAHQLPDRAQAAAAAQGARGDRLRRRRRLGSDQEGAARSCAARRTSSTRTLGGIRDMAKVPSAVWIVDTNKEHIAVDEAASWASRSSRSSTPTAIPTRSTTRSRATTTRSARSRC